jgi:hypothetical protein
MVLMLFYGRAIDGDIVEEDQHTTPQQRSKGAKILFMAF